MKFLCVLGVLWTFAAPTLAIDREAFTFSSYNLDVRIEPEQQRLAVRGKISVRNDSASAQKDLVLQISSTLGWRSVKVGGKPVDFVSHTYASDIDHTGALTEAIVTLPQEVPARGTLEIDVGYEGVIPLDATRLTRIGAPEEKAQHSDWDQINKSFTAVRGLGYVAWYPVATEGASLADSDSVPKTIGRWKARHVDTTMDLRFESTALQGIFFSGTPAPAEMAVEPSIAKTAEFNLAGLGVDVPTFVLAGYQKLTPKDSLVVQYLPGQEEAAKVYGEVAAQIDLNIPAVGHGSQNVQILGLSDPDASSFVTAGMLLTPLNLPMTNEVELSIVCAKARHMVLSPRAWIQEGLAHYAQAAFIEAQQGRQAALDYLSAHASSLVEAEKPAGEKSSTQWQVEHSLITGPADLPRQTKAMYVWWMLKDMLGGLPVEALLDYRAPDDKDAAYVQRLIQARSHRDLQWFFDDWVYQDHGLPDFHVSAVYPRRADTGGYLVTVEIENLGEAGAEVPITLRLPEANIMRRIEVRAKSKASIRIESPVLPLEVVVNDGSVPESDVSNNTYKIESLKH